MRPGGVSMKERGCERIVVGLCVDGIGCAYRLAWGCCGHSRVWWRAPDAARGMLRAPVSD